MTTEHPRLVLMAELEEVLDPEDAVYWLDRIGANVAEDWAGRLVVAEHQAAEAVEAARGAQVVATRERSSDGR